MRPRFIVFYCKMGSESKHLDMKGYLKFSEPDVQSLTDALMQIAQNSEEITVLKFEGGEYSVIYIVPSRVKGLDCIEAYEFLVQKEKGLEKVAQEVIGKSGRDTLKGVFLVLTSVAALFYIGYRYHAFSEISNILLFAGILLSLLGGVLRGYQKKRVRASTPRHHSE